jgi:hypothetical protein
LTATDIGVAAATTVIGVVGGFWISRYFFRRGSLPLKLVVDMVEQARIDPAKVGVRVPMKVGTIEVSNLVVYEIAVTNHGYSRPIG